MYLEDPIMGEAITAYKKVSVSPEFREVERLRSKARHDEAQALFNARREERELANNRWQSVVADKDAEIASLRKQLGQN
jgi:hypothetical protein